MLQLVATTLTWALPLASWAAFLLAGWFFLRMPPENQSRPFQTLIGGFAAFRVLYALAVTIAQYWAWNQHEFTRLFLDSNVGGMFDFFLPYVWTRVWLNLLLSLGFAALFGLFLRTLQKYQGRFFEEGELALGVLVALVVGWPNVISFAIFLFISVIIISLYKLGFRRERYTTLGAPFLFALFLTLVLGHAAIEILGWGALRV